MQRQKEVKYLLSIFDNYENNQNYCVNTVKQALQELLNSNEQKIPTNLETALNCPATLELFDNPTLLNCGHTFSEISASKIERCAECRQLITSRSPNSAMKILIEKLVETNSFLLSDDQFTEYFIHALKNKELAPQEALNKIKKHYKIVDLKQFFLSLVNNKNNNVFYAAQLFLILGKDEKNKLISELRENNAFNQFCLSALQQIVIEDLKEDEEIILKLVDGLKDINSALDPNRAANYTILNYAIDNNTRNLVSNLLNRNNIIIDLTHLFSFIEQLKNDDDNDFKLFIDLWNHRTNTLNINERINGKTALHQAIINNNPKVVGFLLKNGSDVTKNFTVENLYYHRTLSPLEAAILYATQDVTKNIMIQLLNERKIQSIEEVLYMAQDNHHPFFQCYATCLNYCRLGNAVNITKFASVDPNTLGEIIKMVEAHLQLSQRDNANLEGIPKLLKLAFLTNEFARNDNIPSRFPWSTGADGWRERLDLLSNVFDYLSADNNIKENLDLRKTIRDNAFSRFEEYLSSSNLTQTEKLKLLNHARKSKIFSKHQARFFKIGRTKTVSKIDNLIENEKHPVKKN